MGNHGILNAVEMLTGAFMETVDTPIPQVIPLTRIGRGEPVMIALPAHWLDYWREKLGRPLEEVEVYVEGKCLRITPKGVG